MQDHLCQARRNQDDPTTRRATTPQEQEHRVVRAREARRMAPDRLLALALQKLTVPATVAVVVVVVVV
jgi:hypothetical protein